MDLHFSLGGWGFLIFLFFPGSRASNYQLPISLTQRAGRRCGVDQQFAVRNRFAIRYRVPHVAAIEGKSLIDVRTGQTQQGWIPVGDMNRFADGGSFGDVAFPCGKGGDANSPFIMSPFPSSQLSIAGDFAGIGSTVVAVKEEQCIVALARGIDGSNDFSNRLVHGGEHPRVQLALAFEMLKRGEVFLGDLVRAMNRIERDIEEEWLFARVTLDDRDSFFGQQMRAVSFVVARAIIAMPIEPSVADMGVVIDCPVIMPVLVIESSTGW